jgi:hypothetical protein
MFDACCKLLDPLWPQWRSKIIGLTTDGDCRMSGSARMDRVSCGFIRVWCGPHQVELVMQPVFKAPKSDEFYKELTDVTSHLRRQQSLIECLDGKCPKVADRLWLYTGRVASWIAKNMSRLSQHFQERAPHAMLADCVLVGNCLCFVACSEGRQPFHPASSRPQFSPY